MIKSDNKHVVISGNPLDLIQDFVNIMSAFRGVFTDKLGEEKADELISLCGRYAYAKDDSEENMYAERITEVMLDAKKTDMS